MFSVKVLVLEIAKREINKIFMVPQRNVKTYFNVFKVFTLLPLTNTVQISRLKKVFAIYLKSNIQTFLILPYFARHVPQFNVLIKPFLSDVWIAQN